MAELRQGDNGKWTIKDLYHNKPGVKIPATFTYNGYPVSFQIESSPKTIETPWETSLGTSINLADIGRQYSEVVDEAACKKYVVRLNIDEHFTIKPYQEDPYVFQLSPQSIELESTATTQTFTVTATNVSDIGWDSQNSVNVTAGAANSTSATANFTQNTSTTESKGIVFAISGKTSGGRTIHENAAITLKKKGTDQNWNFTISNLEFQSTGGTATAVIECGSATTWTINISNMTGNWLHIPVMSGTGPYTQAITVDNYTGTTSDRTAQVTASDGNRPITYTITQKKKSTLWDFTISKLEFESTGGTATASIQCDSATTWTIAITDIEGNWLDIPVRSGTGPYSQVITVANYTGTTSDRTASVIANGSQPGQTTGYTVRQKKKSAPTGISVSFHPEALDHESGTTALVVECEGEWKLAQSMTWLTIPTTAGTGNFSQQIYVPEYTSTERDRSLTVTASTTDNVYTDTAKFTQKKVSYIEFDVTGVTVSSGETSFTINVSSNTEWSGYTTCEFVSVSPTSGNGNGQLTVTVLVNPYPEDRPCQVYGKIIPDVGTPAICYIEQEAGGDVDIPWLDPHPQQIAFNGEGQYWDSGIWGDYASININGGNIPGWEIVSKPAWISIENETHRVEGESLGYFDVYCEINPDPEEPRDGDIVVESTGDDGLVCTITVNQAERIIYLYAYTGGRYDYENTEQEVPYNPGSDVYGFNIDASHPWKVLTVSYEYGDPGDWIHFVNGYTSGDSGYTPTAVRYTVDSTSTGRYADIYLCLDGYEMAAQQWPSSHAVFRVIQTNDEEMDVTNLDWDSRNQRYYLYFNSSDAQQFSVEVTANCQWSIYSIEDEYGQSYPSSVISCVEGWGPHTGNSALTFNLAENDSTLGGRMIYITLMTADGGVTRYIYITQTRKENPYVTIVSSDPALVDNAAVFENSGVTYILTIDSNVDYSLYNVPSWLTATLNGDKTQLTLTPTGSTSSARTGTIYFDYQGNHYASLDVQQNADAPEPVDNPEILLYDDPNGSYHKTLEFTKSAAAQDVIFYVSSNGTWWMYECDENITVTDEYGNPVGTSESEGEAPTGLLNKRKMKAHIEANLNEGEQPGKRTLIAKFQTVASLWTRYDYAYLEITQLGNTLLFTEPQITQFQLFESPDCDGNYYRAVPNDTSLKPEVYITIRIHDAAGTVDYREDVTVRADTSYLDPSGLVNSRLSIDYPAYDTNTPPRAFVLGPSPHYNPGGGNEHNPYALEVNAYSGYPGTSVAQGCGEAGQPARCGELVLTYQGDTERVTASTQIKQYYCEKPYPDLDFHFSNGADATAITNNTLVSFILSKPTGTEVVYQFQPSFSDPTAYIKLSQSGYDTPEDFWEEHTISSSSSAESISWYLVEGAGHFHVDIYAYDKNTPGTDKTLSLDVN